MALKLSSLFARNVWTSWYSCLVSAWKSDQSWSATTKVTGFYRVVQQSRAISYPLDQYIRNSSNVIIFDNVSGLSSTGSSPRSSISQQFPKNNFWVILEQKIFVCFTENVSKCVSLPQYALEKCNFTTLLDRSLTEQLWCWCSFESEWKYTCTRIPLTTADLTVLLHKENEVVSENSLN